MSDPLLKPGDVWELNACLNYGLDSWYAYAKGYRLAAEALTQRVRDTHRDQDLLIWPVMFMWRHHLELKLKSLSRSATSLLKQHWSPSDSHDLSQLFGDTCVLMEQVYASLGEDYPRARARSLRSAFARLKRIDAKSMVFRYPVDLDGTVHLGTVANINFGVVEEVMSKASDALSEIQDALDYFEEWER